MEDIFPLYFSVVLAFFFLKPESFDRRLCKESILDKLRQKKTESLQELIAAGQKKPDVNSMKAAIRSRAVNSSS